MTKEKNKQAATHRIVLDDIAYLVKSRNTNNKETYIETLFSEYLTSKTEGTSHHEH